MSLYPSLEDMGVDKLRQAQSQAETPPQANQQNASVTPAYPVMENPPAYSSQESPMPLLYPSLDDYMGMRLDSEAIQSTWVVPAANQSVVAAPSQSNQRLSVSNQLVAPVTGNSVGLQRAEIRQGIREVQLCKDQNDKIGLRVRSVNKGIFVAFVHMNSPAAMAGLRFGDQILQIDGQTVAGWDTDKAMKFIKKCKPDCIKMAIRDRPFERTITLQKDSGGRVGFVFKENKITALVKDSSAARNGVLIDHHLVEVNGQNVVGLREKEIAEIFQASPPSVTITILPSVIYDHIMKSIGSSLVKKLMDHSIPDI